MRKKKGLQPNFKTRNSSPCTCKQLMLLNMEKNNQPNGKSGQRSKWIFVQRGRADGRETHEKMLSLTVRETPLKARARCQLRPQRMTILHKSKSC